MATEERELLAAIASAPLDDRPRLVYADWLLERGDPRGELIQVQVALAREASGELAVRLRARERELVEMHHEAWLGTPFHPDIDWLFDRGFPTGLFGHAGMFIDETDAGSFACHRYLPDGRAVSVSVGERPRPDVLRSVAKWFHADYSDGGRYQTTFAPGEPPRLRFSSTSSYGTVDYDGRVRGDVIEHSWHSHINGADGNRALRLVRVEGGDSRLPQRR
jgi:uncharacterized protein (TIGR02996 family)